MDYYSDSLFAFIVYFLTDFICCLFYDYECFACMYVSTLCVFGASMHQKRAPDPLTLLLQIVRSHHLALGTNPMTPAREAGALTTEPSPYLSCCSFSQVCFLNLYPS